MASLHLYNIPTVAATLLYSLQTADTATAVEACSELVESGYEGLALSMCRLGLALAPFRSIDPTIMLSTDITVLLGAALPVVGGGYELPERRAPPLPPAISTRKSVPWTPKSVVNHATLWGAVQDALKHGRVERAAFLASAVQTDDDLTTLLASFRINAAYAEWLPLVPRERVLFHAFSSLQSVKTVYPRILPLRKPLSVGKGGRTFAVTAAALATWNVAAPPLSQLTGEPVWVALEACPTLKPMIIKCGIVGTATGIMAKDDDALEEFYGAVFPDDIPDEWSAAERAKSHAQQGVVFTTNPWLSAFKLTA